MHEPVVTMSPATRPRVASAGALASSTTVPNGSPSRIALPLPRATSSLAPSWLRVRTISMRAKSRSLPAGDRRPGDEGAVVERVGELGERAEAARQARIDDLDGDPQGPRSRRAPRRACTARPGRGGRSRASSNANSHSSLGAMKAAALSVAGAAAGVVHPRAQQRAGDRRRHAERLALCRRHGGDLPAADGAELARHRGLQSIRLGEIARAGAPAARRRSAARRGARSRARCGPLRSRCRSSPHCRRRHGIAGAGAGPR